MGSEMCIRDSTSQGGSVVFFSCALRANSHDVHGLPRFCTNDVLLGTSGVGVWVSVVSSSPGILFLLIGFRRWSSTLGILSPGSFRGPSVYIEWPRVRIWQFDPLIYFWINFRLPAPVFEIRLADHPANDIFLLSAISIKSVYPVSHNSRFSSAANFSHVRLPGRPNFSSRLPGG